MTAPLLYTFRKPVQKGFGKANDVTPPEMLTTVEVRRPTAGDLRVTDLHKGEVGKAIALVSILSGLPPKTIDRIDVEDVEALSDIVGDFSAAGRAG